MESKQYEYIDKNYLQSNIILDNIILRGLCTTEGTENLLVKELLALAICWCENVYFIFDLGICLC